ncbi:RloB family protein [Desmonostoc muscorum LEGE 12446]|uniref:RloB domain-containing protein n=1 Tax=Desmonostoc muscorum LEGE 12446 TaxID=1828758 RepID=A0A8J7A2V4_DESMC|nr:RloB family protein [Desmonostoc muscorum]MCF2148043.1 RloB family protein [Desmonostoc muscorum LEGE 12446]
MPKGKSTNDLRRRSGNKKSRDNFLIVVEGQETEYNYFNALKQDLKLSTTDIRIVSASGGDPLKIIDKTCSLVQENKLEFDRVFCVFDDDNKIEKFQQALLKGKNNHVVCITSIPCFEFWFLLHYAYTTAPFNNYKELCPKLETEMRKAGLLKTTEIYDKSDVKLYQKLQPKIENALTNTVKLEQEHPNEDGCTNPSTKVHILVQNLKDQKEFK